MRFLAAAIATAVLLAAGRASAAEPPSVDEEEADNTLIEDEALGPRGNLRTRAETVSFDARLRVLELSGNVRVDAPPFHLRSQRIKLSRTKLGIEVDGNGRLAFCPCLGTPLTVEFTKAYVAPPGDLILEHPRLEFYGVPVLILPWFWLRSDEKLGLLPPEIAYRGTDGVFVGDGIHVPWKSGGKKMALDVRAGAYLIDGFATEARLRTPASLTRVRYDRLHDDGLLVDARGATNDGELQASWDADVLRGARGVRATTDLDAAAKPWDRASVEGALRAGPFAVAQSVRAVTRRGGDLQDVQSVGPVTTLRGSGAFGGHLTWDATVEGGALRVSNITPVTPDTLSFARAELGAAASGNVGPIASTVSVRGAGDVVAEGTRDGTDRAGVARAHVGVPLARAYRSANDENDPVVHTIEPFVEGSFLAAKGKELLGTPPGRAVGLLDGTAGVSGAGFATSLGRWARRQSVDLSASGGLAVGPHTFFVVATPLVRARASASLAWLGATVDAAAVEEDDRVGNVVVARARLGPATGLRLLANVAERSGVDPIAARLLADAPLEPSAGFLTREGTTGGAGVVVPWSKWLTTSAGADGDATTTELVAVRGGLELRDRCGCLTLRANGSHRIGRPGVDVWVAIDFAADR